VENMAIPTKVEPSNPKLYVTGAISTFVYACTGTAEYVLDVPVAHEVIGIFANFASPTNVDASNWIAVNNSAKTVTVYTTTSIETAAFGLNAMVVAKKAGGVA
jgi:hypothetical protein